MHPEFCPKPHNREDPKSSFPLATLGDIVDGLSQSGTPSDQLHCLITVLVLDCWSKAVMLNSSTVQKQGLSPAAMSPSALPLVYVMELRQGSNMCQTKLCPCPSIWTQEKRKIKLSCIGLPVAYSPGNWVCLVKCECSHVLMDIFQLQRASHFFLYYVHRLSDSI